MACLQKTNGDGGLRYIMGKKNLAQNIEVDKGILNSQRTVSWSCIIGKTYPVNTLLSTKVTVKPEETSCLSYCVVHAESDKYFLNAKQIDRAYGGTLSLFV